jgi:low affinity Fe/Cu permease
MRDLKESYRKLAKATAVWSGSPLATGLACSLVLAWIVTGPYFHFSDTWQLVMNTVSSVVTFLMVFLIQYSQYRESLETQVKINELIRAVGAARNELINLEELSDEQLMSLQDDLSRWAGKYGVQLDAQRMAQLRARRNVAPTATPTTLSGR